MMLQTTILSHRDALKIIDTIRQELERDARSAAVAVVDDHGELIAFLRTDGCPLASINNAINKAFTAARERRTSRAVGQASQTEGFPMTNFGDLRYIGWGGGVPIVHEGKVIGGVGVSGLPEEVDMVLAQLGADALNGTP
jgi:glc operon protein GlcG